MNIPGYVSRALYEKALAASLAANERALMAEARLEQTLEALRAERARYDTLLDQFSRMKQAGAVVEPTPEPPRAVQLVPDKPDAMKDLIHEIAGANVKMRAQMLRQLAKDRAAKVDEDEIEQRIIEGVRSEGVPA